MNHTDEHETEHDITNDRNDILHTKARLTQSSAADEGDILHTETPASWDGVRLDALQELSARRKQWEKKRESRERHLTEVSGLLRIRLFIIVLFVFFVIGLVWPARPDTSVLEKRKLTEFPTFTTESFLDGDYFSGISTWYADTYPLRESMIAGFMKFKNLYGIRSEQLIRRDSTAARENIPASADESVLATSSDASDKTETSVSVSVDAPQNTEATENAGAGNTADAGNAADAADAGNTADTQNTEDAANTADAGNTADTEDTTVAAMDLQGDIYISGNNGYGLYYFHQDQADQMISTFNQIYDKIHDKANMYLMIVPNGSAVELNKATLESLGANYDGDAINYIYSGLEDGIKTIDVCTALKDHKNEYIYYHTDHHWTQLGSYYAYRAFCSVKGITPHELSEFTETDYPGFLGSYYSESNQAPALASNPDTVHTWKPNGTNDMTFVSADGTKTNWWIIGDVSNADASTKYDAFTGGDNPFSYAHNDAIQDGSSVLVVKDSYGNAFIPWLVDHYENIYWIDPRYDTTDTVSKLESEYGIDDVIYECSIYNGTTTVLQDAYAAIGQ